MIENPPGEVFAGEATQSVDEAARARVLRKQGRGDRAALGSDKRVSHQHCSLILMRDSLRILDWCFVMERSTG